MAKKQQGIQSVEIGMRVLRALASTPQEMNLKSISAAAGMSASTAHRYLVSLGRAGLVEQDPVSGRYGLGVQALEIGLAALGRIDSIKVGTAAQAELRKRVDVNSLLAVWGTHGATVIRWEEASQSVTVNVRVGSVMPILTSATGRGFLSWRNDALIVKLIAAEAAQRQKQSLPPVDVDEIRAEARKHGVARVQGHLMTGISGLAVPLLAPDGTALMVLTAFGVQGVFDAHWNGPVANALRAVASEANRRLGPPMLK
jgi:DNA-binding IclR family transcriptional regulator